jgi:hypothetical protein
MLSISRYVFLLAVLWPHLLNAQSLPSHPDYGSHSAYGPFPPFPVQIVKDPIDTQAERENDARSDALSESDLKAQWKAADAAELGARYAEEQTRLARYQFYLSIAGSVALAFSLGFNFISLRQTRRAMSDARYAAQRQIRAYVSWLNGESLVLRSVENNEVAALGIVPVIKNTGQSPAHLVSLYSHLQFVADGEVLPGVIVDRAAATANVELGAQNTFGLTSQHFSIDDAYKIHRRELRCFLFGWGAYRDVFQSEDDQPREFKFCFEVFVISPPDRVEDSKVLDLHAAPEFSLTARD